MKIIMRRVSVIFYSENHGNDNAVRRCLLDKINDFIKKEYYIRYSFFPFSVVIAWISSTDRPRISASFSAMR